jgi:hypothetical protein
MAPILKQSIHKGTGDQLAAIEKISLKYLKGIYSVLPFHPSDRSSTGVAYLSAFRS